MSNVYRFIGSIKDAVNDGNVTTKIVLSDNTQMLVPDDMGNGMVFDINPSTGTTIKLNGVEYQKGNNVAWVKPESGNGYFDELGMNIDVSEITQLRQDVDNIKDQLDSYYKTINIPKNSSWDSSSIGNGIYQISSLILLTPIIRKQSVFIVTIMGGQVVDNVIDSSGNFSEYWEVNEDSYLTIKSTVTSKGNQILNIHKIGDI